MTAASAAAYEGVRFDALAPRPHVESWFVKANDPARRRAIWIRATIFAPARDPHGAVAEAWAIAFREDGTHVVVKTQVPIENARFSKDGIDVAIGNVLELTRSHTKGDVTTGERRLAWDFEIGGREEALLHYPARWMYEKKIPSQKICSPRLDARITGKFQVLGLAGTADTWDLDAWPAMIGHNWGSANTPLYAWAHCNTWSQGEDLVFEASAGTPPFGPGRVPKILGTFHVRHRGVRYDLNDVKSITLSRSSIDTTSEPKTFRFRAKNELASIEGEVWAPAAAFVGLHYFNPSGPMTYCLNSKLANVRLSLALSGRPAFEARSDKCAFEIGTRESSCGVKMYV